MLFLLGLAFSYLINAIMNYNLSWNHIIVMSILSWLYVEIALKNKWHFIVTIIMITFSTISYSIYLYASHQLFTTFDALQSFLSTYYYSIINASTSLSFLHTIVAMSGICLLIYHLFYYLYRIKKTSSYIFIILCIATIIVGDLFGAFNLMTDRDNIIFMWGALILFYIVNTYRKDLKYMRAREVLLLLCIGLICSVTTLISAHIVYKLSPNFFPKVFSLYSEDTSKSQHKNSIKNQEQQLYQYTKSNQFIIHDTFEYQNQLLMTVDTLNAHYLKGDTFEYYDNGIWEKSTTFYHPIDNAPSTPTDTLQDNQSNILYESYRPYYHWETITITYKNLITNHLFTNSYKTDIDAVEEIGSLKFDTLRGTYHSSTPLTSDYSYQFKSTIPKYSYGTIGTLIDYYGASSNNRVKIDYFKEIDPRIKAKAIEISEDALTDLDRIIAIQNYLRDTYTYDTTPFLDDNDNVIEINEKDPVLNFLYHNPRGFCQHFASSMALMVQSIDIPARYVTGFKIPYPDFDERRGMMVQDSLKWITDADAHAWVEVYFKGVGWLIFEPTAIMDAPSYRSNYHPTLQHNNLLENNKQDAKFNEFPYDMLLIFGSIVSLITLVILLYKKKRANRNLSNELKIKRLYYLIIQFLSKLHLKKEPFETPREHAKRVDEKLKPLTSKELLRLIGTYESIIYGKKRCSDSSVMAYKNYFIELKSLIKDKKSTILYTSLLVKEFFSL